MDNKVEYFYENEYDEEKRLSGKCDNRHTVEREVKKYIIESYLPQNGSILEIGAGTGLYCVYFAQKGYNVSACDLVPKHVKIIQEKSEKMKLNINACIANALEVPFENDYFDIVLLSGPVYHLQDKKDKQKAISEAVRCCRKGGIVVIDYLSQIHGFIQSAINNEEFLINSSDEDINDLKCEDAIFSFDRPVNMREMLTNANLQNIKIYGTDSISRFIKKDLNWFGPSALEKWIKFIIRISEESSVIELSEHCLAIGQKR